MNDMDVLEILFYTIILPVNILALFVSLLAMVIGAPD